MDSIKSKIQNAWEKADPKVKQAAGEL